MIAESPSATCYSSCDDLSRIIGAADRDDALRFAISNSLMSVVRLIRGREEPLRMRLPTATRLPQQLGAIPKIVIQKLFNGLHSGLILSSPTAAVSGRWQRIRRSIIPAGPTPHRGAAVRVQRLARRSLHNGKTLPRIPVRTLCHDRQTTRFRT
jgi:hypothetical protein